MSGSRGKAKFENEMKYTFLTTTRTANGNAKRLETVDRCEWRSGRGPIDRGTDVCALAAGGGGRILSPTGQSRWSGSCLLLLLLVPAIRHAGFLHFTSFPFAVVSLFLLNCDHNIK
ncbi:hypothetical protein QTP88_026165 [Uroleucon formosanum]